MGGGGGLSRCDGLLRVKEGSLSSLPGVLQCSEGLRELKTMSVSLLRQAN